MDRHLADKTTDALDPRILEIGRSLSRKKHGPSAVSRAAQNKMMQRMSRDADVMAALFRVVDVAPACDGPAELAAHLAAYLDEVESPTGSVAMVTKVADARMGRRLSGRVARLAVHQMAHRFIVGETPGAAVEELERMWRSGSASTVDLLGEATVTPAEGEIYARRCDEALVALAESSSRWPGNELLEADSFGRIPRVNLSVKVTALTPLIRAEAPERARDDVARHLRRLLRRASELDAHLHVDMESMDSRELILDLVLDLLAEPEFADGPSVGIVLQAYLRDSEEMLDRILARVTLLDRRDPLFIRLVKGAYWDHEVIEAAQHGWVSPVWGQKNESDRCFERLTRRLLDSFPVVRTGIASHNLRSIAHAVAYAESIGLDPGDFEIQVLRGLGDELQEALVSNGFRGRVYSPVGDLVAGMAYLVRRLLENTSNESFLANSQGANLAELLRSP